MATVTQLRVMTYNVRYFGHATRGVISTPGRIRQIARSVACMSPLVDVVCLQEVELASLRSTLATWRPLRARRGTGLSQMDLLMKALDEALEQRGIPERYEGRYFPAHTYRLTRRTNLYTTGLAILVRQRHRVIDHNRGREADITHRRGAKTLKQTRICAHVTVKGEAGGALDVFNTHMSLPGPFYPEFWKPGDSFGHGPNQLVEARQLLEAVRRRRRADHMVLVGDFNSSPDSPVDEVLREEGGLVDALASTKRLTKDRHRAWWTAGFMKKRMNIDRIYASPSLRWLDFNGSTPFDEQLRDNGFAGLSDHVPIVGTARL